MNTTWWIGEGELIEEQKNVIKLPKEHSFMIKGPPGSGKTNLLLLRANYLTLAGEPNLVVLVFTRTLREFIVSGAQQYLFPPEKVMTCSKWLRDLLRSYGVRIDPPDEFKKERRYLLKKVESLIQNRQLSNVYDAILLDEAQDYLEGEIEVFRTLARKLFVVADSRQKIYPGGSDTLDLLDGLVKSTVTLRYHFRNGLNICRLADNIAKDSAGYEPLVPTSQYNETASPSKVVHIPCPTIEKQAERIVETLLLQQKTFPGEMLAVFCPRHKELDVVWERIAKSPLAPHALLQSAGEHQEFSSSTRICACTTHSAKGLEFRTVHIAGSEYFKKFEHQRNLAFTSTTRAKTALSLYSSGVLPGYLEKALVALQPDSKLPSIGDAFRGKQ